MSVTLLLSLAIKVKLFSQMYFNSLVLWPIKVFLSQAYSEIPVFLVSFTVVCAFEHADFWRLSDELPNARHWFPIVL